jgi:hypothetical protein
LYRLLSDPLWVAGRRLDRDAFQARRCDVLTLRPRLKMCAPRVARDTEAHARNRRIPAAGA